MRRHESQLPFLTQSGHRLCIAAGAKVQFPESERFGEPTCSISYWITSSAMARSVEVDLTGSNFTGCMTGKSAGLRQHRRVLPISLRRTIRSLHKGERDATWARQVSSSLARAYSVLLAVYLTS
jgi:hypothetical protein